MYRNPENRICKKNYQPFHFTFTFLPRQFMEKLNIFTNNEDKNTITKKSANTGYWSTYPKSMKFNCGQKFQFF